MAVDRAELITCLAEAREFYLEKLARSHEITRYDRRVTIVFEKELTHPFSKEPEGGDPIPDDELVVRNLGGGRTDVRRFNLERARLMGHILPALSKFVVSTSAQNGNRLVYGPQLPNGQHIRVVLRPGPGSAWTCVSAYPVPAYEVANARRSKAARFPP